MTAPSIKEALERVIEAAERALGYHAAPHDCYATGPSTGNWIADLVACPGCVLKSEIEDAKSALATLQPSGERREAIARILYPTAFMGIDEAPPDAHKQRLQSIALGKVDELLASGLVQDEAGIRANEREKCAKVIDVQFQWDDREEIAAAIRSARDGGAES